MKQSIRNQFDQVYYEADFDPINNWVYVKCKGEVTLSDIQKGALAFAELFEISKASKLLNNTADVIGEFTGLQYWSDTDYVKSLAKKGLKFYAHVTLDIDNKQLADISSALLTGEIEYKVFKSLSKAEKWLKERL